MANDEEIEVEYDRTGVTTSTANNTGFSEELSVYLYPKLNSIPNNGDFSAEDIQMYSLDVDNNNINISTTKKLINYLKSFVKKSLKSINDRLDGKLDIDDYIIDEELDANSGNPVANRALYNEFENKASAIHNHEISDVNSLSSILDGFGNHLDNFSNPHNVTPAQLGIVNKWELKTSGEHINIYYNKYLQLVQIVIAQGYSFPNTNWNPVFEVKKIPILANYSPRKSVVLDIVSNNNDAEMWAYMTSDGDILIKSSMQGTVYFMLSGMYVGNFSPQ